MSGRVDEWIDMPVDWSKYPANWKLEIRPAILERERHRCKWCGVANGDWLKSKCCLEPIYDERNRCLSCRKRRPRVVLTIAHLDHDTLNNHPDNLAALCQRCHLTYDAKQHATNARKTREARSGQAVLL